MKKPETVDISTIPGVSRRIRDSNRAYQEPLYINDNTGIIYKISQNYTEYYTDFEFGGLVSVDILVGDSVGEHG